VTCGRDRRRVIVSDTARADPIDPDCSRGKGGKYHLDAAFVRVQFPRPG